MLIIPAPIYSLAKAAWLLRIMIWRDDGSGAAMPRVGGLGDLK
jgi:hypothetical protein